MPPLNLPVYHRLDKLLEIPFLQTQTPFTDALAPSIKIRSKKICDKNKCSASEPIRKCSSWLISFFSWMDILVCRGEARKQQTHKQFAKKTSLIKLGKLIWRFYEHKHIKINSINTQDYSQFTSHRPNRTLLITESRLTIIRSDSGSSDMLWKSWDAQRWKKG